MEGQGGHVTFYVASEDIEGDLVKAEKLGGTRIMGPEDIGAEIVLGIFNDPEGNMVGLVSAPRPPQD
jgi:predicted enzyme related to lactoylglutathione lyase